MGVKLYQDDGIPGLYATENIPFDEKIIYQRFHFRQPMINNSLLYDARGFQWLLAELDKKEQIAFGYANLNDDHNAEWGLVYIPDLLSTGAVRDKRSRRAADIRRLAIRGNPAKWQGCLAEVRFPRAECKWAQGGLSFAYRGVRILSFKVYARRYRAGSNWFNP